MRSFFIYYTIKGKTEIPADNLDKAQELAEDGQWTREPNSEKITEIEVVENTY